MIIIMAIMESSHLIISDLGLTLDPAPLMQILQMSIKTRVEARARTKLDPNLLLVRITQMYMMTINARIGTRSDVQGLKLDSELHPDLLVQILQASAKTVVKARARVRAKS